MPNKLQTCMIRYSSAFLWRWMFYRPRKVNPHQLTSTAVSPLGDVRSTAADPRSTWAALQAAEVVELWAVYLGSSFSVWATSASTKCPRDSASASNDAGIMNDDPSWLTEVDGVLLSAQKVNTYSCQRQISERANGLRINRVISDSLGIMAFPSVGNG